MLLRYLIPLRWLLITLSGKSVCSNVLAASVSILYCNFVIIGGLIGSDFTSKRTLLAIHLWLVCKRISGSTNGAVMQEKILEKFCKEKTILPVSSVMHAFTILLF